MAMELVVDASAVIAVLLREPQRVAVIETTKSAELLAPSSIHWEIGNAFSAMFKRNRLTLAAAHLALETYRQIPIRFLEVELRDALVLAEAFNLYAYDAYVMECARQHRCPLLALDRGLLSAARKAGLRILELPS